MTRPRIRHTVIPEHVASCPDCALRWQLDLGACAAHRPPERKPREVLGFVWGGGREVEPCSR